MRFDFKKILTTTCTILCLVSSPIVNAAESPASFDKIVFFGDSLSDNGNFYALLYGYMPKSPPYFEGRFSNGFVWSEYVGRYFDENYQIPYTNFAIGGQTALFHNPTNGFLPYTLTMSVDNYLVRTALHDRSTTLFSIWIGANDYLHDVSDPVHVAKDVTDRIQYVIERLMSYGARHFLIINLPNLARSPYGHASDDAALLQIITLDHNARLESQVNKLATDHPEINIHLFDINEVLTNYFDEPEKYNKKYNLNIKHFNSSCWQGGYRLHGSQLSEQHLKTDLHYLLRQHTYSAEHAGISQQDVPQLAQYIWQSPDLRAAYTVAEYVRAGELPCFNPDEFFFWDSLHPTRVVHAMLGTRLSKFIEAHYSPHSPEA